jgi:hypothetical protein
MMRRVTERMKPFYPANAAGVPETAADAEDSYASPPKSSAGHYQNSSLGFNRIRAHLNTGARLKI